ncbi:MAG: serine hydrolase [Candidatus Andersenbacteria bacterium]
MNLLEFVAIAASCLITTSADPLCIEQAINPPIQVAGVSLATPQRTGPAVDVVVTAEAALVWDVATGEILYDKNSRVRRPIASLNKLLSVLIIRDTLSPESILVIPDAAAKAQRAGADISLPINQHASVTDLLAATLIASANDAAVTLAVGSSGSEEAFARTANQYALQHGYRDTKTANASGLSGGEQFSTAYDVHLLLADVYRDPLLQPFLASAGGELITQEGAKRSYKSTNKLLDTYLPIRAAKTGYTVEAGENLAIITPGSSGQLIGAVILGSESRFQDMKILEEWIWRNYNWPATP